MNNKILFMIVNNQVLYSNNQNMDHREWYISLGYSNEGFEQVIRGFVIEGKIIFFKGMNFNYDDSVIKAACIYAPSIRETLKNNNLEVYCGIVINSYGEKWEPVVKIKEEELLGLDYLNKKIEQEEKERMQQEKKQQALNQETKPILDFQNDYQDEKFIKKAILVTIVVLILTIILKVYLFNKQEIMNTSNRMDIFLSFLQVSLLGFSIYGYSKKMEITKYCGVAASICLFFTFDIGDILLGVFYLLFSIDQNYITHTVNFIKDLMNKTKKK